MRRKNQSFYYGGYAMRSHSETRWASMMDYLGVRWLYEKQIYRTRHGGYLPDFYLPDADIFIEVKGPEPTEDEIEKALDVESETGSPVIFAYGKPEMDGIHLIHACLSYHGSGQKVMYSIHEISQGVETWAGKRFCHNFSLAGKIQKTPDCVHVSEIMREIVDGWSDRSDLERAKAEGNRRINAQKMVGDTVLTLPAICLRVFSEKAKGKRLK